MKIVLFAMLILPIASATSVWDMVPLISQVKSMVEGFSGDWRAADQTLKNFVNEGFATSQIRSLYCLVTGDVDKAIDIQKKFAGNLEPIVDSIPILGHIKGAAHLVAGDDEHGWKAIKQATTTTGSVTGAVLGGPLGAVAGHVATDGVISAVDWMVNGDRAQPHGVVDYALTLRDRKAGEHFDALAGIAVNGIMGSVQPIKKNGQKQSKSGTPARPSKTTSAVFAGPSKTASNVTRRPADHDTAAAIIKPSNVQQTTLRLFTSLDRNAGDHFDDAAAGGTNGVTSSVAQPFEKYNYRPPVTVENPSVTQPLSTTPSVVTQSPGTSTVAGSSAVTSTVTQPSSTTFAVTQPSGTTTSTVIEQSMNTSTVARSSDSTLIGTQLPADATSIVDQLPSSTASVVVQRSVNESSTNADQLPSNTTMAVIEQPIINTSTVTRSSNPTLIVTQLPTDATSTVDQPSNTTAVVARLSNITLIDAQPSNTTRPKDDVSANAIDPYSTAKYYSKLHII